jgi:hypothetical protein
MHHLHSAAANSIVALVILIAAIDSAAYLAARTGRYISVRYSRRYRYWVQVEWQTIRSGMTVRASYDPAMSGTVELVIIDRRADWDFAVICPGTAGDDGELVNEGVPFIAPVPELIRVRHKSLRATIAEIRAGHQRPC